MSQDELTRPDPEEERPDDTAAAPDTASQSDALQSDVSRSDASATGEDDPFAAFAEVQRPEDRRKAKSKKDDKKPNKRLRTVLFAAGAVVLLIVILLLVLFLPQGGDDPNSSETPSSDVSSYTVYDKAPKKDDTNSSNSSDTDDTDVVQKIEVKNTHGTYKLIRKDKALVLDGYTDLTLSDTAVSGVADAATKLSATDSLGKATDLAQFGLSTPVATMTVTYTDGSTLTLYLGNATPSESGYYVRLSDSDEVFICSSSTVSDLFEANTALVATSLITAPTARSDDENGKAVLYAVDLTGKNYPQPLSLRRTTEDDPEEYTYFSYLITKPYLRGTNDAVTTALSSFTSLYADSAAVLHPTKAQLAELGFTDPLIRAKLVLAIESTASDETSGTAASGSSDTESKTHQIFYNKTNVELTVGSQDKDGSYYVTVGGTDAVFLVTKSTLSAIAERQYDNSVSTLLFLKSITDIGRIDLTVDGKAHTLTLAHYPDKEDNDETLVVKEGDKQLSTPDFRTLYSRMMGLQRYASATELPSGQPAMRLSMVDTAGKTYLTADFYATSGSLYTVRTSEGELFTIKAGSVTSFIKQLDNFLNGREVLDQ